MCVNLTYFTTQQNGCPKISRQYDASLWLNTKFQVLAAYSDWIHPGEIEIPWYVWYIHPKQMTSGLLEKTWEQQTAKTDPELSA